jgi:Family of unknown function (DUF6455)
MKFLKQAFSWWRKRGASDLFQLDEREISRIAGELNLSSDQLAAIEKSGDDGAALLRRMILANGLDAESIRRAAPDVLRDLEAHCSLCRQQGRCRREIETGRAPQGFDDYCPNAFTLRRLQPKQAT